jgi:hypothetical protein
MGEIKVNFRFNLVKLVTLQALSLRPGQLFDARQVCALTGLRYSTVSSHLAYWAETMCDKQGRPVRLLKRVPSVSGRKLAWRYTIAGPGRRWLNGVNPDLRRDVSSKLALRWAQHLTSYDLPGDEPLTRLTSLKQNLPDEEITLIPGESIYLRIGNNNIRRFAPSTYIGLSWLRIPDGAQWSNNPQVIFTSLERLLGPGNVPIDSSFLDAGLQQKTSIKEDAAPIKIEEPLKSIPESSTEVIHNQAEYFITGVLWKEVQFSRADVIENDDSPEVEQQKRARLMERALVIKKQRELENGNSKNSV